MSDELPPLHKPRYSQRELLQLVPGLTAKSLRNWIDRGILQTVDPARGRGHKLYWAPEAVIGFRVIVELLKFGMPPGDAIGCGQDAISLIGDLYARVGSGSGADNHLRIAMILRDEDGFYLKILPDDLVRADQLRIALPASPCRIEINIDVMIGQALADIRAFEAQRAGGH